MFTGKSFLESESESEMFLFDPYQKYIQSNNETILDQLTFGQYPAIHNNYS